MLSDERRAKLLELIREKKNITLQEIKEVIPVSESTIRRDMAELEVRGEIRRVFGGAMEVRELPDDPEQESEAADPGRVAIARAGAALVSAGDRVYIDSGRTVAEMLRYLAEKEAEYITTSLQAAAYLSSSGFRAYLIGGEMNHQGSVTVGADAILGVQKIRFTLGFFGAGGVSLAMGFTTADVREGLVRRKAVEATLSGRRFFLVGREKFGISRTVPFASLDAGVILTDKEPETPYRQNAEVRVVYEDQRN